MIVKAQSSFHPTSQIPQTLQPTRFSCSSVSLNWRSISQPCSRRCSGLFSKDHDSGEMQWLRKLSRGCFMAKAEKGQKVEVESVHGGEDIFDAASAEAKVQPQHLVIMVNGLVGSAADWRYAAERFVKRLPDKIIVHRSEVNTSRLTFDGVDRMGERLAEEVIKVVQRWPGLKRISFVAHSLGGLVARYAIGILYGISCQTVYASQSDYSSIGEENNCGQHIERIYLAKIAGLEPFNFITFATPHLGSIGREQLPLLCGLPTLERSASQTAHWIAGRSGKHLFLTDKDDGKPLLLRMVNDTDNIKFMFVFVSTIFCFENSRGEENENVVVLMNMITRYSTALYRSALCAFKRRVAYANANYDLVVGWRTSSIRRPQELPKPNLLVKNLDYPHIVHVDQGSTQGINEKVCANTGTGVIDLEEEMIKGLNQVTWERVDVSFHQSKQRYVAHTTIQVKSYWLNSDGADVVEHMIDNFYV